MQQNVLPRFCTARLESVYQSHKGYEDETLLENYH